MCRVLIAIDGSPASMHANAFFAQLPHFRSMEIFLACVVPRTLNRQFAVAFDPDDRQYVKDCRDAESVLNAASEPHLRSGFNVRTMTMEGNPGETIVTMAEELRAGLVLVGATGFGRSSLMALGSVSEHVAMHAPGSVLVIRNPSNNTSPFPVKTCLAYEDTAPGHAAIEELIESSWGTKTELRLISIATGLDDDGSEANKRYLDELSRAKERLTCVADDVETSLEQGNHYGEGIVRYLESNAMDLVILGETPRGHFSLFPLGCTTQYVLRNAPCSVWITRSYLAAEMKKGHFLDQQWRSTH
ncbi:MAG: universal stress protein [Planctomycetota bacterium]